LETKFQDVKAENDIKQHNLLKTYLFEGAAANSNSQFDNKKEDVSYYKLDSKDILGTAKANNNNTHKEEYPRKYEHNTSFSIVHADAMVDGGSVADMYDKTINGIAE